MRQAEAVAALLLGLLVLPTAPAAGHDGRDLLDRWRPLLRYDRSERNFAQEITRPLAVPRRSGAPRVYGHVAREGGETWLQYWLFYADNPLDRGIVQTGRHKGDWELVQLRLGAGGRPDLATYRQHTWAEGCSWRELERVSEAPVVYVANACHANYSRPGTHDRPFPDPNDEADGGGPLARPPVERITNSRPDWLAYEGRWGATRASFIPGEASSPRGPRFQPDDPWSRPASFHRRVARGCDSGPPGAWWQAAALAALGLAVLGAFTFVRRRR